MPNFNISVIFRTDKIFIHLKIFIYNKDAII